jgi:hypothetical protein
MFFPARGRLRAAVSPILPVALRSIRRPALRLALATLMLPVGVGVAAAAAAAPRSAGAAPRSASAAPRSASAARAAGGAAVAQAGAPSCTPRTLDASAQLAGAVTVSPMPGAADASPGTQISFLGVPLAALSDVTVTGSVSGAHSGQLEAYSQGDGGSFVPAKPFVAGETVNVSAELTMSGTQQPLQFAFSVADEDPLTTTPERLHPVAAGATQQFVSRPDLVPPVVTVETSSPQQAPGDEFLAPYGVAGQAGPMILDPSGRLVWFAPLPPATEAANLRVQEYEGEPVLTWWQGRITVHGFGLGVDVIAGSHYEKIAEVRAGNGYQADLHEFQITPAGTALLSAYGAVHCDLSSLGGSSDGAVTDSLFQEIDIRTGLVMFEWTSLDHVALADSYTPVAGTSAVWPFDFFHLNSINLDPDGTLLVSSRNTWAVDDIDAQTGQLVWTLGGKQSSFTEGHGAATSYQHDARPVGPDLYSVFDNGATPQVHAQSRGVVLALNPQQHSVSLQSQYLHPGRRLLADSQGDMQQLAGGDWFVGWGQEPDLSEFSPGGALLFNASLPSGYESYRALCFPWVGTPLRPPALALRRSSGGATLAYASWNGATQVARWELLEGTTPQRLARVALAAKAGFETAISVPGERGTRFVAVRALDGAGATLGTSATLPVPAGNG